MKILRCFLISKDKNQLDFFKEEEEEEEIRFLFKSISSLLVGSEIFGKTSALFICSKNNA